MKCCLVGLRRNPERQRLTLKCFDADSFGADDALGYAMMPVQALCTGEGPADLDVELQGDGGGGHVHLSVSYSPFTGVMKYDKRDERSIRNKTFFWNIIRRIFKCLIYQHLNIITVPGPSLCGAQLQ